MVQASCFGGAGTGGHRDLSTPGRRVPPARCSFPCYHRSALRLSFLYRFNNKHRTFLSFSQAVFAQRTPELPKRLQMHLNQAGQGSHGFLASPERVPPSPPAPGTGEGWASPALGTWGGGATPRILSVPRSGSHSSTHGEDGFSSDIFTGDRVGSFPSIRSAGKKMALGDTKRAQSLLLAQTGSQSEADLLP